MSIGNLLLFVLEEENISKINVNKVKEQLKNGANPNVNNKYGKTPLHYAVENNYTEVAKLLLEHGADLNEKDKDGKTPLDIAYKMGNTEIIQLLKTN